MKGNNMTKSYPAIFEELESGIYTVCFPDFDNLYTEGKSLEEAVANANEALASYIDKADAANEAIPRGSLKEAVRLEKEQFVKMIPVCA
jgi:predicted RNase H-like HicB family nuclease